MKPSMSESIRSVSVIQYDLWSSVDNKNNITWFRLINSAKSWINDSVFERDKEMVTYLHDLLWFFKILSISICEDFVSRYQKNSKCQLIIHTTIITMYSHGKMEDLMCV